MQKDYLISCVEFGAPFDLVICYSADIGDGCVIVDGMVPSVGARGRVERNCKQCGTWSGFCKTSTMQLTVPNVILLINA